MSPRGNCNRGKPSHVGLNPPMRVGSGGWESLQPGSKACWTLASQDCPYLAPPCTSPHPPLLPFLYLPQAPSQQGQPSYLKHQSQFPHIQNVNAALFVGTSEFVSGFHPPASSLPMNALPLRSLDPFFLLLLSPLFVSQVLLAVREASRGESEQKGGLRRTYSCLAPKSKGLLP